jgi:hypothetical protein
VIDGIPRLSVFSVPLVGQQSRSLFPSVLVLLTYTVPKFLNAICFVSLPSRWKILVEMSEHSRQWLNVVLKQFDILEENNLCGP